MLLLLDHTAPAAKKNVKPFISPGNRVKAAVGLKKRKQPLMILCGNREIRENELDVNSLAYVF